MYISELDAYCFERAIQVALEAEEQGNLPIGAVITLDGNIIAEGRNAIWCPRLSLHRHAEMEALRQVPEHLWPHCGRMTLYTTLEPCLMCTGAILLHRIGRVLYGSADTYGGGSTAFGHMSTYFEERISETEWYGPVYPEGCDELFARVTELEQERSALEAGRDQ